MTTNYLLDAIDRLAKPHRTKVPMANEAGITCISEVEHDPLLQQLRDAIAGGTSRRAGVVASREKIPLNVGAHELYAAISKQVNAWYLALPEHQRRHDYLWNRLNAWYVDYDRRRIAGQVTDVTDHDTTKLVEGWARSIDRMFDPPTVIELTDEIRDARDRVIGHTPSACPACGQRYAHDPRTGDQVTALIIEYRELGEVTLDHATGLCRFCENVWRGRHGVRELRWAIDHPKEDSDTPAA